MIPPTARLLPDGRRLHLQHGPIDLVVEAIGRRPSPPPQGEGDRAKRGGGGCPRNPVDGPPPPGFAWSPSPSGGGDADLAVREAYRAATARFATILDELCTELPLLKRPVDGTACRLQGRVARRMHHAVLPFAVDGFITPMAAVAGAVAEEVLLAMTGAADLARASVNNGGDIALYLAEGEEVRIGLVNRPDRPRLAGTATIRFGDPVRGIATSGWRGRSFSLGIADAVTILARTAAEADAAATIVANAVDLPGHPAVTRVPAREVQADSDLGGLLVTCDVGRLSPADIRSALAAGLAKAEALIARGLIEAAALNVQGQMLSTVATNFHRQRHAEEVGEAGRLEARTTGGACFETRTSGPLLSMAPDGDGKGSRSMAA
ncbi:UPF0280 family protein [uncultured Enterovirga sp.]|uniref:UPF0280 family protein n=1 Tax=uncultured Enterovirga sp. TaxID=2026352 RepID=UPI0035CBE473